MQAKTKSKTTRTCVNGEKVDGTNARTYTKHKLFIDNVRRAKPKP